MPIYEYRCDACGEDLEVTQRITADKLVECPACDEPKLRRLISRTSFTLKGSGWYATDYAKPSKGEKATESGAEGGADKGASDSEPAKDAKAGSKSADASSPSPSSPTPKPSDKSAGSSSSD